MMRLIVTAFTIAISLPHVATGNEAQWPTYEPLFEQLKDDLGLNQPIPWCIAPEPGAMTPIPVDENIEISNNDSCPEATES